MQDFAGMVDDEDSFVLSVFIVGNIYIIRIRIAKVDLFASFFARVSLLS